MSDEKRANAHGHFRRYREMKIGLGDAMRIVDNHRAKFEVLKRMTPVPSQYGEEVKIYTAARVYAKRQRKDLAAYE